MRYLVFFLFIYCFPTFGQQPNSKQKIIALSDSIRAAMPREKVYIHLDKSIYLASDTIWFKAYLINASSNTYSKVSGLIYVDLIDEQGEVMNTLALPTALGVTWGCFPLGNNNYKTGNYTLRAYTNWMQNFGDAHLFKKSIKILNGNNEQVAVLTSLPKHSETKNSDTSHKIREIETDIQFLPEGGKWLVGITQKIAFKALNELGKSIQISGEIFDSKQNKITDFSSNTKGMGYFNILAEPNEKYTAKIKSKFGLIKDKALLNSFESGTALQVEHSFGSDSLTVRVFSTIPYQDFTIIGQSRGMICFITNVKSRVIKIAKSVFPTGVGQIILVDNNHQKLNERSFFINHNDELKIDLSSNFTSYTLRDSISINLNVTDYLKIPLQGTFSVAVTDDNQVEKNSTIDDNILTYFLLSSELKGEIESPNYYFDKVDVEKYNALDALMLTQGWISYDWNLTKKPRFNAEKDYTISGRVNNILKKPSENARIIMLGSNKSVLFMDTITNKNGEFIFDNLPLLDSASVVIQARNAKGKSGTLSFEMNEFKRPSIIVTPSQKRADNEAVIDSISTKMVETQRLQDVSKNGIALKEVKIIGKRIVKGTKNATGRVIRELTEEDIEKVSKYSLLRLLQDKIKGFRVGIRPQTTKKAYYFHLAELNFVFDGIHIAQFFSSSDSNSNDDYLLFIQGFLDYYTAEDIKGVELVEVSPFSAYVEITTKTGVGPYLKKAANIYLLKPMNYGSQTVFYNPKYTSTTKAAKKLDYRSTLYWAPHILTDKDGKASFSFFSADKKGTYTVWVEGSDMQGNFGIKTMKLEIK